MSKEKVESICRKKCDFGKFTNFVLENVSKRMDVQRDPISHYCRFLYKNNTIIINQYR